jgi:DNA-binding protein HU-beta
MNKTQLIDTVAGKTGQSKAQTAKYLDALLATLATSLADGEPVQLIGFGSFTVTGRPPRQGRNPQTGQPMALPAKKTVKFKPGKTLADAVDERAKY